MNHILANIKPFRGVKVKINNDQSTSDIITGMLNAHKLHAADYNNIFRFFNDKSIIKICKNLYTYLLENTYYVVEPDSKQTLRSPAAILTLGANKKIGLDCKSYSLFIGGVLDAIKRNTGRKIDWCYRFASYKSFNKMPHHVFVVVNPDTNNEIWIDCCIPTFNQKKPYKFKIDKKMALYSISGIGRKTKAERQERKKEIKAKIKAKIKKGLKVVLKFSPVTAAGRNAFLLLTKLNVLNVAKKLNLLQRKPSGLIKLRKFWEGIGGNFNNFQKNIAQGSKLRPHKENSVSGIGVVAVATATATATPIILKIINMLKEAGINTDDLAKKGKELLEKVAKNKLDDLADKILKKEDSKDDSGVKDSSVDTSNVDSNSDNSSDSSGDNVLGFMYNNNVRFKNVSSLFKKY